MARKRKTTDVIIDPMDDIPMIVYNDCPVVEVGGKIFVDLSCLSEPDLKNPYVYKDFFYNEDTEEWEEILKD